jgi:hypothetical protein
VAILHKSVLKNWLSPSTGPINQFLNNQLPLQRKTEFKMLQHVHDRLCGLVVRVLGYRFGGPGSIPGTTKKKKKKKVVGLERGPLSLVSTTEELLDRKVEAPV